MITLAILKVATDQDFLTGKLKDSSTYDPIALVAAVCTIQAVLSSSNLLHMLSNINHSVARPG